MKDRSSSPDFARAFGDALSAFLESGQISRSEAAKRLRLDKPGKTGGKARLSAYCHDSPKGTRPTPNAEFLYRLCSELGFHFEYQGYRISAATLNGSTTRLARSAAEQIPLAFDRQFDLTDDRGTVSVSVKQPSGRVEVALSLKAAL